MISFFFFFSISPGPLHDILGRLESSLAKLIQGLGNLIIKNREGKKLFVMYGMDKHLCELLEQDFVLSQIQYASVSRTAMNRSIKELVSLL